jgi:endonuclease/exonuclease/phosphatase (EEP) superfamily protein YafD
VFFATHLSLTPADEKASAEIIAHEASTFHKPVFLAGDMNSTPSSETQIILRRHFTTLTDTLWTTCESTCIDYIYAIPNKHLRLATIYRQLIHNDSASDHRPILIRLRFNKK